MRHLGSSSKGDCNDHAAKMEVFRHQADGISEKVIMLDQKLKEVEKFYATANINPQDSSVARSTTKDKAKDKHIPGIRKQQRDAAQREAAAFKRMQDLMRQFGTIFRQITQHKLAWPFMHPVDVEGLGLHDYYEIIDKPMDFSTIKNQMDAKDGTGYKNVRQVYADVRLVFENAMKYNEEKSNVYIMAKTLSEKFEEKWSKLLPKVEEEEKRREDEEAAAHVDMLLAKEVAHAKMTRDISNELDEVDTVLGELKDIIVQKCRKMSTEEKRVLGAALARLCPDDLGKALEIVAQSDLCFQATAEDVKLDIDSLSEYTLWRLKVFAKDALNSRIRSQAEESEDGHTKRISNSKKKKSHSNKRKQGKRIVEDKTKNKKKTLSS